MRMTLFPAIARSLINSPALSHIRILGLKNCETPFEIENPASGTPDLNKVGIRTFGCPTQFKDVGPERGSFDDEGKLRNPN